MPADVNFFLNIYLSRSRAVTVLLCIQYELAAIIRYRRDNPLIMDAGIAKLVPSIIERTQIGP